MVSQDNMAEVTMLCNSGYINEGFLIANVCHVTEIKVNYFFQLQSVNFLCCSFLPSHASIHTAKLDVMTGKI